MICGTGRLMSREGSGGLPRAGLAGYWLFGTDNLLKWSEEFQRWIFASCVVTSDAAIAPDGNQTADRAVIGSTLDGLYQNLAGLSAGQQYTFSFWAKNNGGAQAKYLVWNNTASAAVVAATSYVGGISDWARISVSFVVPSGCLSIGLYPLYNANADVFLWGAMLNEGPTALPYVKTMDLQTIPDLSGQGKTLQLGSTSGADANDPRLTQAGAVFDGVDDYGVCSSTVLNGAGRTLVAVAKVASDPGSRGYGMLQAGGNATYHTITAGLHYFASDTYGGAQVTAAHPSALSLDTWYFLASRRATDRFELWVDTSRYVAGASGALAVPAPLGYVGTFDGALGPFDGTIAAVLSYDRALSDAEVARLYGWLKAELAPRGVTLG